jgi:membrane protease YdiL (CAAX protease family)
MNPTPKMQRERVSHLKGPPDRQARVRSVVVWLSVIPASILGDIICHAVLNVDPPRWLDLANLVFLALLLVITRVVSGLKPLQGYLVSLVALDIGYAVGNLIESTSRWAAWRARVPTHQFIFADSLIDLIPCALLGLSLIGSGMNRRDIFLQRGNMSAPARLPFGLPAISWKWLGPFLILFLAGGLAAQLMSTVRPDFRTVQRAVSGLPWAIAFAAFNAAQEEFRFRVVLLGRLIPCVGAGKALLVTSVIFGLAHWFGHPSGLSGVFLAGFAGWLWGKSIVDTQGFTWAWLIHGLQDVVIFLFLLMAGQ